MTKMKATIISLIMCILILTGCEKQHHKIPKNEVVTVYKVYDDLIDVDDAWYYYYLIFDAQTKTYYYSESSVPNAPYNTLTWSKTDSAPRELEEAEQVGALETVRADVTTTANLGTSLEEEIESSYSNIPDENSLDSMEGVPESSASESSDVESSSDLESESTEEDAGGGED